MTLSPISRQTARRFVLGRQGLWPGRRETGALGAANALRRSEAIQVDTINVIARCHDLALWSRTLDYQPADLDRLMYQERQFFDYGGILFVYPMAELPYWQVVMRQRQAHRAEVAQTHQATIAFVLDEIRARGPLANRDFLDRPRIPGGYNTVKDTALALQHLWLCGALMTHHRRGFDRVYGLFEDIAGQALDQPEISEADAQDFFALKALRDLGLATAGEWARRLAIFQPKAFRPDAARQQFAHLAARGLATPVGVEGQAEPYFVSCEDAPLLDVLEAGDIPAAWRSLGPTTRREATFLAPLDNVIWDRTRARTLFDFDYVWEVYKPAETRRWGYYTLPILYGDRLVGRLSPKLHRKAKTLAVEGFWLEDPALADDPDFADALRAGLTRFARFHDAERLDLAGVPFLNLRAHCADWLP